MDQTCTGLVVLVLAAGSSQRMGKDNKLLLPVGEESLLSRALTAATQCCASEVYLLTGFERQRILAEAKKFSIKEIYNPEYKAGQDKSIAVGLSVLAAGKTSVLVLLGDQPDITAQMLDELIMAHYADGASRALIPVFRQRKGTPRILPLRLVELAAQVEGKFSLRKRLSSSEENVHLYDINNAAVLLDIDTPADYRQYMKD